MTTELVDHSWQFDDVLQEFQDRAVTAGLVVFALALKYNEIISLSD